MEEKPINYNDQLRGEIKLDLIKKFDFIKSEVEIKGQELIQEIKEDKIYNEERKKDEIDELSIKIGHTIEKINVCYDFSLKDVNDYFDELDNKRIVIDSNKTKEEIKKEIIKHDLIYLDKKTIRGNRYHFLARFMFGILIEVNIYIDEDHYNLFM